MSQSVFHAHYWRDCARLTTQKLCVMGVLMALQIILSRITAINLGNWLRISFGFLPNAIAGYLLGPIGGTLVAWGSDALGTILTGQAINPGLSVAAALGGFFYGLMLHKRVAGVPLPAEHLLSGDGGLHRGVRRRGLSRVCPRACPPDLRRRRNDARVD